MAKSRAGDIAAKLPKAQRKPEPGNWERVTVVMRPDQTVRLDKLALAIRERTGAKVNRAALIRGIIDGVLGSGLDLAGAGGEQQIKAAVGDRLGAAK